MTQSPFKLSLLLLPLMLSGCIKIFPDPAPPTKIYVMSPQLNFPSHIPEVKWQLVIEKPFANAGHDTSRIAVMTSDSMLDYYADANWIDRAPIMVQNLIVEAFENSNKIVGVGRQSLGLRSDYTLKSELRAFQAELNTKDGTPQVHVHISAKLTRMPGRNIIASNNFVQIVKAKSGRMHDIVEAFDQALDKIQADLVVWTLNEGEKQMLEVRG